MFCFESKSSFNIEGEKKSPKGESRVSASRVEYVLLGRFSFSWILSCVQGLQKTKESGGLTNPTELDAEGLDLDK